MKNFKMLDEEKGSLMTLIIMLVMASVVALFYFVLKKASPVIIIVMFLLGIYLVVIPNFCTLFYKLHGKKAGLEKWIPFYNETLAMTPANANITLVSILILIISISLCVINPDLFGNILPESILLRYSEYALRSLVIAIMINGIVTGVGLSSVYLSLNKIHNNFYAKKRKKMSKVVTPLVVVLCYLPIVRGIVFILMYTQLNRLVVINKVKIKFKEK